MISLQIYWELLLLPTFLQVHLNLKEVSDLSWQHKYPDLKTAWHVKQKFFFWAKILENLLLAKYLISVPLAVNLQRQSLPMALAMKVNLKPSNYVLMSLLKISEMLEVYLCKISDSESSDFYYNITIRGIRLNRVRISILWIGKLIHFWFFMIQFFSCSLKISIRKHNIKKEKDF